MERASAEGLDPGAVHWADTGPGDAYWSRSAETLAAALGSRPDRPAGGLTVGLTVGLTGAQAAERLARVGPNRVEETTQVGAARLLLRQIENPLVLILLFAAAVSLVLHAWTDAAIILAIVCGSALLGFFQEYRASAAVAALKSRLALECRVLRDGEARSVPVETVVPGDVILLSAGNLVPADGVLLEAADFLVSEAAMTGESFPVEKRPGVSAADAPPAERRNAVFLGSSVRSGTARMLAVRTGRRTAFGAIAARVGADAPETDFHRGVRRFGFMLVRVMVVIVLLVLTANLLLGRPTIDSLLFAVALAVGLSPELLPAIVSVTLASGARTMSGRGVIVRRLDAIENLGAMDVLCTDKTGTLTEGTIVLADALDPAGLASPEVLRLALVNATLETGIENPLDRAIVAAGGALEAGIIKVDEIPYDFVRRRLTIVVAEEGAAPGAAGAHLMITKGAFANVIAACTHVGPAGGGAGEERPLDAEARAALDALFESGGRQGFRVLGVATRRMPARAAYGRDDEAGMTFRGFLVFRDPPKPDAADTIGDLARLGIAVKVVTGDNRHVAAHLAGEIGLDPASLLTGEDLATLSDEALGHRAPGTDLFVEIDPQQKERIVRALQRAGHTVGYLGDGINDAPALHAADIGISVQGAVDVARESADIVLLQSDLGVLRSGVELGRATFANTLKYIGITTSANFGNMVSMALAAPLLPFLPLLAKQILLNNFLSDIPSVAISGDNVDPERLARPQRWSIAEIRRFMIVFGLVSSAFDLLTFGLLLHLFRADEATFQTGWFVISVLTELAVLLVLRTRGSALRSRPSPLLLWGTLATAAAALTLPFLGPASAAFGFVPLSPALLAAVAAVVLGYVVATEAAKRRFYRIRPPGTPASPGGSA